MVPNQGELEGQRFSHDIRRNSSPSKMENWSCHTIALRSRQNDSSCYCENHHRDVEAIDSQIMQASC